MCVGFRVALFHQMPTLYMVRWQAHRTFILPVVNSEVPIFSMVVEMDHLPTMDHLLGWRLRRWKPPPFSSTDSVYNSASDGLCVCDSRPPD